MYRKDITGEKFGRLTVLECRGKDKFSKYFWLCKCECGKETTVQTSSLKCGETQSCGCLRKEGMTTHNKSQTRIYRIWVSIIDRCTNSKCKSFDNYGGRGISICDEWHHSFETFYNDIGKHRPTPAHSIDRINTNGNYEPGNCKWATRFEQDRNKVNSRYIQFNGMNMVIGDWAKHLGVNRGTLCWHIAKMEFKDVYKKYTENA